MIKLNPDERLVIESSTNHYKLVGPGRIWLKPWQKALTTLYVGPQGQTWQCDAVRTRENIPVNITAQILYQIDVQLLSHDLLVKTPQLNKGGWKNILTWRLEHVLRQLVADYSWRKLSQKNVQQRLERQWTQTVAEALQVVGLRLLAIYLIKTELPADLQETLIESERDGIEPRGRALVLKKYFDIFGHDLARVMPYIVQWELLNTLRKGDNRQYLLTSSVLSPDGQPLPAGSSQPVYQMQLPLPQE